MNDLAPGDAIRLDDIPAEVIKTYSVGDLEYLRAYVEDVGVKTVCIDDVGIERTPDQLDALDPATATHTDYRKSLPVVRRNGSANHRETVTINTIRPFDGDINCSSNHESDSYRGEE